MLLHQKNANKITCKFQVHIELVGIVEREENSRKTLNKIHGRIDEIDDQVEQLAGDRKNNADALTHLRSSIIELEKLIQEQMENDLEQGQKVEHQIADLVSSKNNIILQNEETGSKIDF